MSRILALAAAAAMLLTASQAGAVACRDAAGKFIACPVAKTAVKMAPCRDQGGKFIKCPATKRTAVNIPTGAAAKAMKK